ncbi:MAG: SUMF1/EgtB/PvdO family nonheme iron enzyme, partial [Myxococcota bacterium]
DPPGATVTLYRYVLRRRRLVEVFDRVLGTTPLDAEALPMGRYLCVLSRGGHQDVRQPVEIRRLQHWTGIRPGDDVPLPIWLPPTGTFGADEIYVPAGWFWSGGDPEAYNALPARRLWCDAFVAQRFVVTAAEYLAFLDDLVARGREEEALGLAPRYPGRADEPGAQLTHRTASGGFVLRPDHQGDTWHDRWPIPNVNWWGASAYLTWRAERTGLPWRLPGEFEWEKAARGVDGRLYPWGDTVDASWAHIGTSHPTTPIRNPSVVDGYPVDCSPYGVRGMAGNIREWCLDSRGRIVDDIVVATPEEGPDRQVKGASWSNIARAARLAGRGAFSIKIRSPDYGFRGVYSVGEAARGAAD